MPLLMTAMVFASTSALTEFCEGYKVGYETVYHNAAANIVTAPNCPAQPQKDFIGQSDFSQGYYVGAVAGLRAGEAAK